MVNIFFVFLTVLWGASVHAESLDAALVRVYQSHPKLLAERGKVKALSETVFEARSGWHPRVNATASTGHQSTSSQSLFTTGGTTPSSALPTFNQKFHSDTIGIEVVQPLFRGGRTAAANRRAENETMAGKLRLMDVEQTLLLEATRVYRDMLLAETTKKLREQNVKRIEKHLELEKARSEVGVGKLTDLEQAKARYARAQADFAQAVGDVVKQQELYRSYFNDLPNDLVVPQDIPLDGIKTLDDLVLKATTAHPVYVAARFDEEARRCKVNEIRGELYPEVHLKATASHARFPNSFVPKSNDVAVMVEASVPIFPSGSAHARSRQAREEARSRAFIAEDVNRTVRARAVSAWQNHQTSLALVKARVAQVEASGIAREAVAKEVEVGTRRAIDKFDAEQDFLDAEEGLERAKRDLFMAHHEILEVGGLHTARALKLPVQDLDPKVHYGKVARDLNGSGR